ncbi:hypothetical protein LINGRAHAP2_LOCUS33693 [Linum grandiflorum]
MRRRECGEVCDGRSGTLFCSSAIESEARALLESVSYACSSPLRCTIYSDCLDLVECIKETKTLVTVGHRNAMARSEA